MGGGWEAVRKGDQSYHWDYWLIVTYIYIYINISHAVPDRAAEVSP